MSFINFEDNYDESDFIMLENQWCIDLTKFTTDGNIREDEPTTILSPHSNEPSKDALNLFQHGNEEETATIQIFPTQVNAPDNPFLEEEKNFKRRYYSIFLGNVKGKNLFQKQFVIKIHQNICTKLDLPPIKRTNRRCIKTYFRDFLADSEKILKYIEENKEELSVLIDLQKILEQKNAKKHRKI